MKRLLASFLSLCSHTSTLFTVGLCSSSFLFVSCAQDQSFVPESEHHHQLSKKKFFLNHLLKPFSPLLKKRGLKTLVQTSNYVLRPPSTKTFLLS